MRISIKTLNGEQYSVDIVEDAEVLGLKVKLWEEHQLAVERQRLIFAGRELEDQKPISEYGIVDGSTLHLVIRQQVMPPPQQVAVEMGNVQGNGVGQPAPPQYQIPVGGNPMAFQRFGDPQAQANQGAGGLAPPLNDSWTVSRACRLVRWFSFIDGAFMFMMAIAINSLFILLVPLAAAGYYGAKKLQRKYLLAYSVYVVLNMIIRIAWMVIAPNALNVILSLLAVFIDIYILRLVIRLYQTIPTLTPEQRDHILQLNRMGFL